MIKNSTLSPKIKERSIEYYEDFVPNIAFQGTIRVAYFWENE